MASLADLAGYSSDGSSPSKGQIDDTIADGDNRTKETVSSVIVNETSFSTSGDQVTEQKTTEVAETLVESGVDGSENSDASTTKRRRQSFLEKIPPPSSEAVSKIMVNIVQDYIDAKNCEGFDLTEVCIFS